ncbi:unnamed protein product [Tilletia controversa]|nr:unnamed protein product [Tilletia controversa]
MIFSTSLFSAVLAALALSSAAQASSVEELPNRAKSSSSLPGHLIFTAVLGGPAHLSPTSNASDPNAAVSRFECWQLSRAFQVSPQQGTTGSVQTQLGNLANATYTYFPSLSPGTAHVAPYPQYVFIISGGAAIRLPNDTATVRGGAGLGVIAADSSSKTGHFSDWDAGTTVLQIPFEAGAFPPHTVLHQGACKPATNLGYNSTTA